MENQQNLAELSKEISNKLLDSANLLKTLEEIIDGKAQEATLLIIIQNNIKSAFDKIEKCRTMICPLD